MTGTIGWPQTTEKSETPETLEMPETTTRTEAMT